jgi:AmmeMemoRadiSam system protein A
MDVSEVDDHPAGRGETLLALARSSLNEALRGEAFDPPEAGWLDQPGACFVTLKQEGRLRGCIGSIHVHRTLAEDVRENARAAALRDPRFSPLTEDELVHTSIEVSLLSPLEAVGFSSEEELLAQIRPAIDGLVLEYGEYRGTFLPAVWENLPRPADFLRQLKRKAGLETDFWSPEMKVWRFTVDHWSE